MPLVHSTGRRVALAAIPLVALAAFTTGRAVPPCAPDNGGLSLPDGFCAGIVVFPLAMNRCRRSPAQPAAISSPANLPSAIEAAPSASGSVRQALLDLYKSSEKLSRSYST